MELFKVPLLWPSIATPQNEVASIRNLYAHLWGLYYSVEAWQAGLLLYQTANDPPVSVPLSIARRWRWIGCNECILELYHLRCRLEKIQSVQLRKCPSVRTLVDVSTLRAARKRLDEYFPDIEYLRHATAHKGENEAHPEEHAPDGQYALTRLQEPDKYTAPYRGRLCTLDITYDSLQRIAEVVSDFLRAFNGAAAELERQGHLE